MIPLVAPPLVTLDLRATPLAKALPTLAKAYGVPMRASPAIGAEIVTLSLKGASLPALRERLAAAFAGGWSVAKDGTLVFGPDARARGRQAREEVARKVARVERFFIFPREEARGAPAFTPERARARREAIGDEETPMTNAPVGSPGGRLLVRVLAGLRAADLGLAIEDTRVVFSSRPTPMQRAFPFDAGPLVADWVREEAVWRESDPRGNAGPPRLPDRLTLAVSGSEEGVSFEMFGTDARGVPVVAEFAEASFDEERDEEPSSELNAPLNLKLSPESRAFARAFPARGADGDGPREEARPFLDAVAREPLSFLASDLAFAVARASGRSVVSAEPDAAPAVEVARSVGEGATLGDLRAFLDLGKPGWALLRSPNPERGRRGFAPRAALARALRLAYASPKPDLPTLARIAALLPGNGVEPALWPKVARLAPGLEEWATLALLGEAAGALGPRVFSPEGVAVGELPPELRARAARIAFVRLASAFEVRPGRGELPSGIFEITTWLPDGLPPGARLRVRATEEPLFEVAKDGGSEMFDAMGLASAARLARASGTDLGRIGVTLQMRSEIGLALALSDGGEMGTFTIVATPGAADPATYTLATLPPAARAALDAAEAELARQDRFRAGMTGESSGEPPPR